jgi:hypothetical protein
MQTTDGAHMDEQDMTDLRVIELALMNPRSGTPAAQALEQLTAQVGKLDAQRYPRTTHPVSGALCFCKAFCEGASCHCWCHEGESPP